jgi:cytosine/adenosine deaminase-related metal-dependent hydrolase
MGSLLIRDIHTLATMDDRRSILDGAWLYALDGEIREMGRGAPPRRKADRTLRAAHLLAVPGLINTHHHLYQTLTRALPAAADVPLFPWLVTLYPLWARLDEEAVYTAALVGLAELMLSGCTTAADHHYVFPRGQTRLIDAEIAAAARLGIRFHACRGSMSLSVKDGGLPPDSVVQSEDEILADCERVIRKYHDPRPGGMVQIALAPCSPFSVTKRLMVLMAELARQRGVRLHTHLAETRDEEDYCYARYRQRPVDLLEETGWLDSRTWIAHGIHLNGLERKRLGRAGVGVAHCPSSNMRLGSGIAPVIDLRRNGCPVGLGVDGSASNDGSHLLAEARQALLLARVAHGAAAMTVMQALEMATRDGARCLGRDDIGSIQPGRRADIALFDLRALEYSGAGAPLPALLLCAPTRVHTLVVEGRVVVEDGQLCALRLEPVLRAHRRLAARLRRE